MQLGFDRRDWATSPGGSLACSLRKLGRLSPNADSPPTRRNVRRDIPVQSADRPVTRSSMAGLQTTGGHSRRGTADPGRSTYRVAVVAGKSSGKSRYGTSRLIHKLD